MFICFMQHDVGYDQWIITLLDVMTDVCYYVVSG